MGLPEAQLGARQLSSGGRDTTATPHAPSCSASTGAGDACFTAKSKSYTREWRLWATARNDDVEKSWPKAVNEDEEVEHGKRFDGILPLLEQEELAAKAEHLAKVQQAALDAGAVPSGGEGGRRLTASEKSRAKKLEADAWRAVDDAERALEDAATALEGSKAAAAGTTGRRLADVKGDRLSQEELEETVSSQVGEESEEAAFTISATSTYTAKNAVSSEYAWSYIVEPYRVTTLSVNDPVDGATYEWSVDGHLQGYGTSVEVLFMEVGYHVVSVREAIAGTDADASGSLDFSTAAVNKVVTKVMCKYVRREVRSLTDADREAWLSAVQVLQRVPTGVGQDLYGSAYYSKDHFTRTHLYYGGALDCDHWHQGAGFVTSHVAQTLQWEQALQAVNPSIAAPYWDFTVESTFYGASDWRTSFIFADDWFGEASPDNDLHTVVTGRWAFNPTMVGSKDYSYWTNSYGVMRAPWNADPTPFLTRAAAVYGYQNNIKPSGCAEYARALKKTTWMSMSKQLNSAAHGHIHELMGGSWNHYFATKLEGETSPAIFTFAHQIQALSKILWREGYVSCPDECDMSDAAADCQCTCSAETLQDKTAAEVLHETGVLAAAEFFDAAYHSLSKDNWLNASTGDYLDPIPGYSASDSKHIYNSLLSLLCNPGHLGDMYQATSTNDITFWVIHNTVDRLWHYKRLGNLANYDETWDPYHTCYGHNPRNVQPFQNLFEEAAPVSAHRRRLEADGVSGKAPASLMNDHSSAKTSTKADHYYTNMELYEYLHPNNRGLQYVYDSFEWSHCDKQGYQMTNLW